MSLILDALNRADQQRSDENPSPNPLHYHQPILPTARPVVRWIIEGLVLLLIIGVVVYSQWPSGNKELPPVVSSPAFTSHDTVLTTAAGETLSAEVASLDSPAAVEHTQPTVRPQTSDPAIPSLYQTTPVDSSKESVLDSPVQISDIDQSRAILLEIPLLTDRSSRFQRAVPTIDYQIHVYSDKENAGFVKLNGSIHKIGSQILPGMRVVAILKDSVVLDYQGTPFRLPAMNSWMNYN